VGPFRNPAKLKEMVNFALDTLKDGKVVGFYMEVSLEGQEDNEVVSLGSLAKE
jgi:hypothetical protein